jgi:3-hydroxybutyryl-CoA dehydrogenase
MYFRAMKSLKVAVIGAGQMGNGIAHVFAQCGYQVNLVDVSETGLQKAIQTITKNLDRQISKGQIDAAAKQSTLDRIRSFSEMQAAVTDRGLVIEAATERIDLKLDIFRKLDDFTASDCILATNTSSISITRIAAATRRPEKVIGMHFMNPVPVMKLVEIINGYSTAAEVAQMIKELSIDLGKVPVVVNDYPGFVANKILMPMINEAIITLHEGTAGVEEIDTVMKLGMAHPMGPLRLADFIGLDTCLSILRVLQEGYGLDKYSPCPLLVNMVTAGKLGDKTGEGFYSYADPKNPEVAGSFQRRM